MKNKYNVIDGTISIDIKDYDSEEEFWNAVGEQAKILTKSHYVVIVRYEDCGVYAIDYIYSPREEDTYRDMINTYNMHMTEELYPKTEDEN